MCAMCQPLYAIGLLVCVKEMFMLYNLKIYWNQSPYIFSGMAAIQFTALESQNTSVAMQWSSKVIF